VKQARRRADTMLRVGHSSILMARFPERKNAARAIANRLTAVNPT